MLSLGRPADAGGLPKKMGEEELPMEVESARVMTGATGAAVVGLILGGGAVCAATWGNDGA